MRKVCRRRHHKCKCGPDARRNAQAPVELNILRAFALRVRSWRRVGELCDKQQLVWKAAAVVLVAQPASWLPQAGFILPVTMAANPVRCARCLIRLVKKQCQLEALPPEWCARVKAPGNQI